MRLPDTSYNNTSLRKLNPTNSFSSGSQRISWSLNHNSNHSSTESDTGEQRYRYDKDGKRLAYTQRQALEKEEDVYTKINHSIEEKRNTRLPDTSYNTASLRKLNPANSSSSSSRTNSWSLSNHSSNHSSASDTGEQRYRYDKDGKRLTYTQRQALEKQEGEHTKINHSIEEKRNTRLPDTSYNTTSLRKLNPNNSFSSSS